MKKFKDILRVSVEILKALYNLLRIFKFVIDVID